VNSTYQMTHYVSVLRLPFPTLPVFSLFPKIIVDSFTITMVAYTIAMSMALIFAQKHNYEVDSNQELFAQVKILTTLWVQAF